jgi:hypothetical protein
VWLSARSACCPACVAAPKNEGHERRYFYGSVWAVTIAQPVLWLLWKVVPVSHQGDALKLGVVRRHSRRRRLPVAARRAAPHAPDPARRVGHRLGRTVTGTIDALAAPTLKHVRELWWDDTFTEFLVETLRPRPATSFSTSAAARGRPR